MQISSVSVWGDSIGKCVVFDEARGRYAICKDNYASHLKAGGVTVDSHNDHRIAMMAAVAAPRCAAPVTITGAECVAKSYPDFWEDYERLGGQIQRS
mgnify:CR=1 FL=1